MEGSGKGTQVRLAQEFFEHEGVEVLMTREPGGTPVGEEVRNLLLDPDTGRIEPRTEALLFSASRAQHVATVIRPALADGKVVICDRYVDSSLAYQGIARGLGVEPVLELNLHAVQGLLPDTTVLLLVDPDEAARRSGETDRLEREGAGFRRRVDAAYRELASTFPDRIVAVDGTFPPDRLSELIRVRLRSRI